MVAALAGMAVLLRPLEARGALVEEVLVEMVEMSLFRLTAWLAVEGAEAEALEPAPPLARLRIWEMAAPIRARARMEAVTA